MKKAGILIGVGVLVTSISLYFLYNQYLNDPKGKGEVSEKTKKNKIIFTR